MTTTRVTVDVPNEWIADLRNTISEWPDFGSAVDGLSRWSSSALIARLVVDAAPQPVEVTITLTPPDAASLASDMAADRAVMDRLEIATCRALRAQGYGATPAPLAEGDTFWYEGEKVKVTWAGQGRVEVDGRSVGARTLTVDGTTFEGVTDAYTPLRLALVESARAAGFAMPWDAR